MSAIYEDQFIYSLNSYTNQLKLIGADPSKVDRFELGIKSDLESITASGGHGTPYGFVILQNDNGLENDLCPVYRFSAKYSKKASYYVFYCEHLLANNQIEIIGLFVYPVAVFENDKILWKYTSIFGMKSNNMPEQRRDLLNDVRQRGYSIPDNAESRKLRTLISKTVFTLENHLRSPLKDRRFLESRGYYVVSGRIVYVPLNRSTRY